VSIFKGYCWSDLWGLIKTLYRYSITTSIALCRSVLYRFQNLARFVLTPTCGVRPPLPLFFLDRGYL